MSLQLVEIMEKTAFHSQFLAQFLKELTAVCTVRSCFVHK